ncbi:hypothetical protein A3X38_28575 [Salmonella enterica subsp. enterica serovar Florida]|nr:hypothetical protein [Salmonella enterica subsp. enterica serovar Florida]
MVEFKLLPEKVTSKIHNSHFFAQFKIRTSESACKLCHVWFHTLKNCAFLSVSFCTIFVPEFAHFAYLFRTTQTRAVTGFAGIFRGTILWYVFLLFAYLTFVPVELTQLLIFSTFFPTIRPSDHPTIRPSDHFKYWTDFFAYSLCSLIRAAHIDPFPA